MTTPTPPAVWTSLAARLPALWVLVGGVFKGIAGTPGDLPPLVRSLPLPVFLTLGLVVGIEVLVGLLGVLRPGRAWPAVAGLLVVYLAVLASLLAAGAPSCGCLGSTISIPPWVMAAVDAGLLVLLLAARPWRLPRGGRLDLAAGTAAVVAAVVLGLLSNRPADPSRPDAGGSVVLDVASWVGKDLRSTDLGTWADLSDARDGVWFLYVDSCEVCAECLRRMAWFEHGQREVTLVRLPEKGKPVAVHDLPQGPWVRRVVLPETVDWVMTPSPPGRLVVEGGVVRSAKAGLLPDDCP